MVALGKLQAKFVQEAEKADRRVAELCKSFKANVADLDKRSDALQTKLDDIRGRLAAVEKTFPSLKSDPGIAELPKMQNEFDVWRGGAAARIHFPERCTANRLSPRDHALKLSEGSRRQGVDGRQDG